jgi:serine protease AprX
VPDNITRNAHSGSDRLPIKLILPHQGRERVVHGGGAAPRPFRQVDDQYRSRLTNQVDALRKAVQTPSKKIGSSPARVRLIPKALAKSHRPDSLFSQDSCPIIGVGGPGELFIKVTPSGLEDIARRVQHSHSDRIIKEISSIESIEPITPNFRRAGVPSEDILRRSPRKRKGRGFLTRVQLFDLRASTDQENLLADFRETCGQAQIAVNGGGYSSTSLTFEAECRSSNDVDVLSNIVGVRSISQMPLIRIVRPLVLNPGSLPRKLPVATGLKGDFPVVAVVDSGIIKSIPELESWVIGRESFVPETYRNAEHGTFVAGLICWGSQLNPNLAGIESGLCGVLDLQVIPNGDPSKGDVDALTETEFLQSLETALRQHSNKVKVWNLSLGTDVICSLSGFSPLAVELDDLQERYNVSFVISAGNYDSPPLLAYPRTGRQLEVGRITSPADSVLGITVGSISHLDYKKNGPREHHPSAFSRHGAGPNYIIKPDVVHYGGTCSMDTAHQSGVRSICGSGCAEDLGTSFAAPLVSRTLAQIYHQVAPSPSPVLARALLTHHSRDPRNGGRVPDGEENFFGFGLPSPVPYCLECTPYTSTVVFEDTLRPGYFLEWTDFPYPASLHRKGRYFGEIWMTVAFAPARDKRWGSEYCETHLEASFGVYFKQTSRTSGIESLKFKGLAPPEHRNLGSLYESYQVEKLRKWAPVRTYHGALGAKGERGEHWRLMVRLLTRHGVEDSEAFKSQPFALILTIADPDGKAPVYDEMAQIVRTRFKAQNLNVRAATRIRAQG